eukprot:2411139-Lingulodinium_polyedra.AAC.1
MVRDAARHGRNAPRSTKRRGISSSSSEQDSLCEEGAQESSGFPRLRAGPSAELQAEALPAPCRGLR